jgi:hypothetical protein
MPAVVTEVLYVRLPLSLKMDLERIAEEHGVSLAFAVSRAVECYLIDRCGRADLPERRAPLP